MMKGYQRFANCRNWQPTFNSTNPDGSRLGHGEDSNAENRSEPTSGEFARHRDARFFQAPIAGSCFSSAKARETLCRWLLEARRRQFKREADRLDVAATQRIQC